MLKDEWQLEVDLQSEVEKSDSIGDDDIVEMVVANAANITYPNFNEDSSVS